MVFGVIAEKRHRRVSSPGHLTFAVPMDRGRVNFGSWCDEKSRGTRQFLRRVSRLGRVDEDRMPMQIRGGLIVADSATGGFGERSSFLTN